MSDTLTEVQAGEDAVAAPPAAVAAQAPATVKPAKTARVKSTVKKTRSVELTLKVTGTAEGEWQADLTHGSTRIVTALTIPASAVARAAKELHSDVAAGIDTILETARSQHLARMEELETELARVKAQLAGLPD